MNRRQAIGTLGGGLVMIGGAYAAYQEVQRKAELARAVRDAQRVLRANGPEPFTFVSCSFSISHAEWLNGTGDLPKVGPPWLECLERILELKKWGSIRLSMPWSEVETAPGVYIFSEPNNRFERAIQLCASYDIPVVLCIGVKSPRWPEVYIPEFYKQRYGHEPPTTLASPFGQKLAGYLKACLQPYGHDTRVRAMQIENEPFEPVGPDPQVTIPDSLLREEVALARNIVSREIPLWVTMGAGQTESFERAREIRTPLLDRLLTLREVTSVGLNVYQKGFWQAKDKVEGFEAKGEHWGHTRNLVDSIKRQGKRPFLSEVQAEPWEADPKQMDFRNPLANASFTPEIYRHILTMSQRMGVEEAVLWGLEFQVACAHQGNPVFLEMTEDLLNLGTVEIV